MKIHKDFKAEDYKLCYAERDRVYFTTQELSKQWGDDWNDAPYEHNAGAPYTWREGEPLHDVVYVTHSASLDLPNDGYCNSPYSVEDINVGACAWLRNLYTEPKVIIHAGTTLPEFIEKIRSMGAEVLVPLNWTE